ncbi:hypothetical protein XAP6164_1350002 [Xanthomonas phaseoli pv. phaseoli]|nr:hypothetical protein XAP6164_1350002 [Xanthomonas phaseoli pv. phaseoli]
MRLLLDAQPSCLQWHAHRATAMAHRTPSHSRHRFRARHPSRTRCHRTSPLQEATWHVPRPSRNPSPASLAAKASRSRSVVSASLRTSPRSARPAAGSKCSPPTSARRAMTATKPPDAANTAAGCSAWCREVGLLYRHATARWHVCFWGTSLSCRRITQERNSMRGRVACGDDLRNDFAQAADARQPNAAGRWRLAPHPRKHPRRVPADSTCMRMWACTH